MSANMSRTGYINRSVERIGHQDWNVVLIVNARSGQNTRVATMTMFAGLVIGKSEMEEVEKWQEANMAQIGRVTVEGQLARQAFYVLLEKMGGHALYPCARNHGILVPRYPGAGIGILRYVPEPRCLCRLVAAAGGMGVRISGYKRYL